MRVGVDGVAGGAATCALMGEARIGATIAVAGCSIDEVSDAAEPTPAEALLDAVGRMTGVSGDRGVCALAVGGEATAIASAHD